MDTMNILGKDVPISFVAANLNNREKSRIAMYYDIIEALPHAESIAELSRNLHPIYNIEPDTITRIISI